MSYLNLDLDYRTHIKTVRLIGLLGREAEVLPIRLWCYTGRHHSGTGTLSGYSPQEIESAVDWWGKTGDMVAAMLKSGHLSKNEGGDYIVVDFLEHNGHLKTFKERARKAAFERWGNASSNAKNETSIASSNALTKPTKPTKPTKNIFTPPTFEEVALYCKERGNSINPQAFLDHYQANGWVRGKTKIKDWRACIRTWEINDRQRQKSPFTPHQQASIDSMKRLEERLEKEKL